LGFFNFLFFSLSVHHFVFFLLGFGSHFLGLTSIVAKVLQLLFDNHVTETQYVG
jgi:hypothetical protein